MGGACSGPGSRLWDKRAPLMHRPFAGPGPRLWDRSELVGFLKGSSAPTAPYGGKGGRGVKLIYKVSFGDPMEKRQKKNKEKNQMVN